jgi:hypothetical protein
MDAMTLPLTDTRRLSPVHLIHTSPRIARRLRRTAAITALSAGVIAALNAGSALADPIVYVSKSARSNPTCATASKTRAFKTIAAALGCSGAGGIVSIGPGTFAGGFTVPYGVVVEGAGANQTTISDATAISVPEVTIAPGAAVHIENLTVSGGPSGNAGIAAGSGSLTLAKVTVTGTFARQSSQAAGVSVVPGANTAYLFISDSTISDNALGLSAGGVAAGALNGPWVEVDITNSTISGNAGGNAGGISVTNGELQLDDDTITDNGGGTNASGVYVGRDTTATIGDTVIADNQSGYPGVPDCAVGDVQAELNDGGHNLIGAATPGVNHDCGFTNAVNGNLVGTASAPLDPQLAPLAANGGPTETRAPLPGSPVIDAGSPSDCQGSEIGDLDQRGRSRAAATRLSCDIGADDTGGKGGHVWNVAPKPGATATCATTSAKKPLPTIGAALSCARNGDTVKLAAGSYAGGVTIPDNIILDGAGATKTTIGDSAQLGTAEIDVAPQVSATIKGLSVNGHQTNPGIDAGSGNLVIERVLVTKDQVGGALPAPVSLAPSSGNGELTVLDSTISNSTGGVAGGVYLNAAVPQPPAVAPPPSTALIANTTISGDTGDLHGGGIVVDNASLVLRDSTIADNTGNDSGGLFVGPTGTASVTDTLLATNLTLSKTANTSDCVNEQGTVVDGGHNLIGVAAPGTFEDCGFVSAQNNDLTGSASTPLNPGIGPLANNRGPTPTQALLSGSPAIGAGDQADCLAAPVSGLDQRGVSRQAGSRGSCDIGAYDTGGA